MRIVHYLLFALLACVQLIGCGSGARTFSIQGDTFLLDGDSVVLRSGEIHFDRIPKAYWRHRLQMLRAMGLNTVCTYLFWNKAEPEQDRFDQRNFDDMAEFCRLAQEEGLWVILRPGPYVCAEWDMGGLPWWLLRKEGIGLRSQDPYFLERTRKYLNKVGETLAPLQITQGGPILMVQVENEYGHWGTDTTYLGIIRDYLVESGFDVPMFQCDYFARLVDRREDLFCAANFGTHEDPRVALDSLRSVMPQGPLFVAEFYPGWLDHWGERHGRVATDAVIRQLDYFENHRVSYNFYMVHGGTSFGLWSGANFNVGGHYDPQTSSYNYDAPISEAGWATPKYEAIRTFLQQRLPEETFPAVPERPQTMAVAEFTLEETAPVLENLSRPVLDDTPRNMEHYGQGFGYVVYSTTLPRDASGSIVFEGVHDFAVVLLDGKVIRTLDRRKNETVCELPAGRMHGEAELSVIVEAMGRVNSDVYLGDRKGLVGPVVLQNGTTRTPLEKWRIHTAPLQNDQAPAGLGFSPMTVLPDQPAYYRGWFEADEAKDTFLDMRNWGKGVVWVNGHCLGRFWNIGPTQTMYLPAPWIVPGRNEVVVLDLLTPSKPALQGLENPILDDCRE